MLCLNTLLASSIGVVESRQLYIDFKPDVVIRFDPDYGKECNVRRDERRSVISGNLTLRSAADIEAFRCAKRITGNLKLELDNDIKVLVLPWLEKVEGNLWLEAGAYFDKARLTKLHTIGGKITLYNRNRNAHWWLPALTSHNGTLEVVAGVSNDLTGFDHLAYVQKLYLRTHPNDIYGPFNFSGLNSLTNVGNIEINVEHGQSSGSFLANLITVDNKVEITLDDGGLFGLSSIVNIGGRLEIKDSSYLYNLNHFSNLASLGGLELEDNPNLNNINQLLGVNMPSNGYIKIVYNNSLSQCSAKQVVKGLRNDPNWNNFNGNSTYVYGNGYPDC